MYCKNCGKEINEGVAFCSHCGTKTNESESKTTPNEKLLKCPKCKSTRLTDNKKGFSAGKAVAGAVLAGGVGILAGAIGSNKVQITCLNCGHKFLPGEDADNAMTKRIEKAKAQKASQEFQWKLMKSPIFWIILVIAIILYAYIIS
ncbi:zinc-ribbon domain-containing protein [Plebeiibacterium sediminum]|uniref:Zinc-ribbon domain-containing protein n=1 Tax=Plebeiibacterium sediminum TaxID=2992112 RepID=A0AAE3M9M7_9BACT|nr:zinc-ribbon domain-containing protein [Plebeiobacterium sediminum]MCW3789477.1 zinc-ribbon domain-containing protein [Plebeiobacterium sediminum]